LEVYTRFQDTGIHTSVTLHKLSHFGNCTKKNSLTFPIQFAGPAAASNLLIAAAEKRSASNHSQSKGSASSYHIKCLHPWLSINESFNSSFFFHNCQK
jgi:hypothetical protein